MAGKPVSRILFGARTKCYNAVVIIPLGPDSHLGSSSLPEGTDEPGQLSPPIWPCTTRGLPCRPDCSGRGGLLPHRFTLTVHNHLQLTRVSFRQTNRRFSFGRSPRQFAPAVCFLWHCPLPDSCGLLALTMRTRVPWRYQARCPVGVRTFLPACLLAKTCPAITRPARQPQYNLARRIGLINWGQDYYKPKPQFIPRRNDQFPAVPETVNGFAV